MNSKLTKVIGTEKVSTQFDVCHSRKSFLGAKGNNVSGFSSSPFIWHIDEEINEDREQYEQKVMQRVYDSSNNFKAN